MSLSRDYYYVKQLNNLYISLSNSKTSLFSTFHLGICSLPKNHDQLVHYLSSLRHAFSFISLSEKWLTEETTVIYDIPPYNAVHHWRTLRVGGDVSIFVHKSLQFLLRQHITLTSDNSDDESLFIEITSFSSLGGKEVVIGCDYQPPDTDRMDPWTNAANA